jgi:hypothetical protein
MTARDKSAHTRREFTLTTRGIRTILLAEKPSVTSSPHDVAFDSVDGTISLLAVLRVSPSSVAFVLLGGCSSPRSAVFVGSEHR